MNNQKATELLRECKLQLEYLNEKFPQTGTTNSLLAKINSFLAGTENESTDNRPLAESIYRDLNIKGAGLGNLSILIIEETLDEYGKDK